MLKWRRLGFCCWPITFLRRHAFLGGDHEADSAVIKNAGHTCPLIIFTGQKKSDSSLEVKMKAIEWFCEVDYYNWEWWYKELWKVFSTTDRSLTWSSHYRAELKDSYRNILGHVRTVFFTRYAYNWPASTNHFFSGSFIITAHYCGSVLSWIEVLGTLLRLSMPAVFIWRHTEGFSFWFQPMLYTCQCTGCMAWRYEP